jgi:TRAP-type transport system periplasmic protein
MFKRSIILVTLKLLFLILIFSVGAVRSEPLTLRYSLPWPTKHGNSIIAAEWAREVEKRTNGAVKIQVFPGGTLTPLEGTYDGLVKGACDIGLSVVSYVKGRFPLSEVIDLPLGYKSGLQATLLANAYFTKFKPKEFDDVKILYMQAHGPGLLSTKKPVHKKEDLQGMRIRCTGTSMKIVSSLGGIPVAMPQSETYDALKKGVIDGVLSPRESLQGWKLADQVNYTTEDFDTAYTLLFFTAMNKQKWEQLPKDVQETIEKINQEWIEKSGRSWSQLDESGKEFALSKNHKFIPLSKEEDERWVKMVQPVLAEYVKSTDAKGLPGVNALEYCQEWLKNNP